MADDDINADVFDDLIEDEIQPAQSEKIQELIVELQARCKAANITLTEIKDEVDISSTSWSVEMGNGKEKRRRFLHSETSIRRFLSVPFEKYIYLADYSAICSYSDGTIEAVVRPLINAMPSSLVFSRLFKTKSLEEVVFSREPPRDTKSEGNLEVDSHAHKSLKISIGPTSTVGKVLASTRVHSTTFSLKITDTNIRQHDEATKLLETIANALFFEIDLGHNLSLALVKARPRFGVNQRAVRNITSVNIAFPKHEYDPAAISLYWYAKSAAGMPLLQYLAFYQVMEFYFPTYSQREAGRKLRRVLKDPSFRADRESDINKVLSLVKVSRSGSFGSERAQLRSTFSECLDEDELRRFLNQSDDRKEFFSGKQKGISKYKINLPNLSADLRGEAADLIYDIRCKIVHAKGDGSEDEVELLLPFSREAELLRNYIPLAQYVAQQILIASSRVTEF